MFFLSAYFIIYIEIIFIWTDYNPYINLKKGGIGLNELEQPLISLGIAESREEVKKIIDSVDDDGNIEFKEFLCIIKGKEKRGGARNNSKNAAIIEFFKGI